MVKLFFVSVFLVQIVFGANPVLAAEALQFAKFRHVDVALSAKPENLPSALTLLVDESFAPFSFKTATGQLSGVAVDLGLGACAVLRITCQVRAVPFQALTSNLQDKQGEVILGGLTARAAQDVGLAATKPYFYAFGQFVARSGTSFKGVGSKALAGLRVGFVKGTQHELYLKDGYDQTGLVPFSSDEVMLESLRTGQLDIAFTDSLRAVFWLKGNASRGCCVAFGRAIVDREHFTRGLFMALRTEDVALRDAFDFALDRLQENGETAKIFAKYLPSSPF